MEIARLGEQALIRRVAGILSASVPPKPGVLIGIGDDAALVRAPDAHHILKTDHLVEGVHFQHRWAPPADLGWKAMAINISDIASMGGLPDSALVALALPPTTEVEWVDAFYRGIAEAASRFGIAVVGGDTSAAPLVVISIFLTGTPPLDARGEPRPLLRSAGKVGDAVAVTGAVGAAAAGLRLLQAGNGGGPEAAVLTRAHLRPEPRVQAGRLLVEEGVLAAIDVSDGLVGDLERLCLASGLAARVDAQDVPLDPAALRCFSESEALEMALTGGEDYELLFSAAVEIVARVRARSDVPVTVIGRLVEGTAGHVSVRDARGREMKLSKPGWSHF